MSLKSINRKIDNKRVSNMRAIVLMVVLAIALPLTFTLHTEIQAKATEDKVDVIKTPTDEVENVVDEVIEETVEISLEDKLEILATVIGDNKDAFILEAVNADEFIIPSMGTDEDLKDMYKFNKIGYTNKMIDCFKRPDVKHDKLDGLPMNTKVKYSDYDDNWKIAKHKSYILFIRKSDVSKNKLKYVTKSAWSGDRTKSYMDYRAITARRSPQYILQHGYAVTDTTGIRTVNGRYCVALGSYYTHDVGRHVDVVLQNGKVLPCIIGDCKANRDTMYNHSVGSNGGVCEFVVDTYYLPRMVKTMGDCSYVAKDWKSKVKEIRILNENVFSK